MKKTAEFLKVIDNKSKTVILENIARNYGISQKEALEEVTGDDAENLLDYVTGPERAATSCLMQKYGFR